MLIGRNRYVAAALAAVLSASAVAAPAQAREPARASRNLSQTATPESLGFSSERLQRFDAAMARVVAEGRVAGMTTYLARHGRVVHFKTYGDQRLGGPAMSRDTIFRIYSMTKPVTGVAMMMLYEEGKWRLDDPVTKFVPEFRELKVMDGVDAAGKPILEPMKRAPTMRELMSHTGGFGYALSDTHPVDRMFREREVLRSDGLQAMIDKMKGIPLRSQPGTEWYYSASVDVQGYIVEKLSGRTLGQFFQERIFSPLKMKDTAFYVAPEKVGRLAAMYGGPAGKLVESTGPSPQDFTKPPPLESGGGGLTSTTTDYARFAQMLLNGGELDGARILSPGSVELMRINHIPEAALDAPRSRYNQAIGFGLDFQVVSDPRKIGSLEGAGTYSWWGIGGTWFWIDPASDVIFVGMIQKPGGTGDIDLQSYSRTLVYQALVDPAK